MQVGPDYTQTFISGLQFSAYFGIEFKGPGFYLSEGDTVLVVPMPPQERPTAENVWNTGQEVGTIYAAHVWNCNYGATIFAVVSVAPVRVDKRERVNA